MQTLNFNIFNTEIVYILQADDKMKDLILTVSITKEFINTI